MEWEQPDSINLSGARVALGPLRFDLVWLYNRWRNDFWTQRTLGFPIRPVTIESTEQTITSWAQSDDLIYFTIYRHDTWQPIGMTDLQSIDMMHRTAEFGLHIGESDLRNQGYGAEVARLVLHYAFRTLGLHSVFLSVDGANPGGQRSYEKAGFQYAGRQREAIMIDAQRYDLIHMDALASEFVEPAIMHWGAPE